jgi:hypothetical protein
MWGVNDVEPIPWWQWRKRRRVWAQQAEVLRELWRRLDENLPVTIVPEQSGFTVTPGHRYSHLSPPLVPEGEQ